MANCVRVGFFWREFSGFGEEEKKCVEWKFT